MFRVALGLLLLTGTAAAQDAPERNDTIAAVTTRIEGRIVREEGEIRQHSPGDPFYFRPAGSTASYQVDFAVDRDTRARLSKCIEEDGIGCRVSITGDVDVIGSEIRLMISELGPPSED